ncbi:D-2-hydroxyacid dehydrogenase [Desertibaculum subflavum]|uniref:D-2-hydroxyacid dehydrogenase n=1 Tax=Desertibaculum subflavum TaxID=2268458 RepID=UPI000E667D8C
MELLIYENAHRRIGSLLGDVRLVRVQSDGRLVRDGTAVEAEALSLDAAYASPDIFRIPEAARGFFRAVLKSSTVRWLQSGAAGLDDAAFQRVAAKGVAITANDAASVPIAEYVFAEVLSVFQNQAARRKAQAEHRWDRLAFREIAGTTWLIVGLGAIGNAVAKRAKAFEATVLGIRQDPAKGGMADEVAGMDALPRFLPRADVVVIATPLTEATAHLVDAAFLDRLKPGAVLVNIARGKVVDEAALLAALDRGRPAHAVLDVFVDEPLPQESPFWAHPGVTVTAHAAARGDGFIARGDRLFLDNLARFRAGEPLRNLARL